MNDHKITKANTGTAFYPVEMFLQENEAGTQNDMETPSTGTSFIKRAKKKISKIRKATLRTLTRCKQTGTFIAISSLALGDGHYVSAVEDIYTSGNDEIVVLKWYDKNNLASLTHVFIEEILSIQPLKRMSL